MIAPGHLDCVCECDSDIAYTVIKGTLSLGLLAINFMWPSRAIGQLCVCVSCVRQKNEIRHCNVDVWYPVILLYLRLGQGYRLKFKVILQENAATAIDAFDFQCYYTLNTFTAADNNTII